MENFINEEQIAQVLGENIQPETSRINDILVKSRLCQGLNFSEVAALTSISDPAQLEALFDSAKEIKEKIYGKRLVIFAPLYISNLCGNECTYCAFRAKNKDLKRRALSMAEIAHETEILVKQGHKRVLLVAGESYPKEGFSYVLKSIEAVYGAKCGNGEIRRVNVNVAPLTPEQFRELKASGIGTYQLFQETYHHETYKKVHLGGKKADYDWRITAMDRAMEAGIDDVGIGVLFGLSDWRFEILALLQHIAHLEKKYGVGPHTLSVPRLEPAVGSDLATHPPHAVSDIDFRKIVAILRLAVPYTGIIMSTRETPYMRKETFALGVSQISAGSRTNPGGYAEGEELSEQFQLGDHRELDEVIKDVAELGYTPSFCTGCYRLGRTGKDFMDMAKPGDIRMHCEPNALSTFQEYLMDYASPETVVIGEKRIAELLSSMDEKAAARARELVNKVKSGKRDVFC